MNKKIILFFLLALIFSCKIKNNISEIDNIKVYKDLGQVQRTFDITIGSFWAFKSVDLDSIFIDKTQSLKLEKNLETLQSIRKTEIFMSPKYAFLVIYRNKKDTLYMDENLRKGYYKNAHIEIEDKKGLLKIELEKLSPVFFDGKSN
ncbi:hypothetical protein [uncultured Flavobacterium sp.]|uniref:hypothetical protein n=1 Tax=uncultured Flavobacterium sp. TaxID=165435 RepID=UPI0011F713DB|nr:hypothetical protein [uncultured Flavobacterium sp.]THD31606.1 MAG: hypothetical protein DI588_10480 [Flavobacterium johnsoniae]